MDLSTLNWFAFGVAALIPFATGFVWYGPLFGKAWMRSAGLTEKGDCAHFSVVSPEA